ncbi:hypothetical protein OPT61_g3045 [Boeremia exigua]|uniref:Uncharacterized protein n=1 Tax=Boeremia exigua TaxID=749465 RepID=A0ACC2IJE9_9PLEO|nr:hypothetical protein OPT61_g3045 [Boeremia exigua]
MTTDHGAEEQALDFLQDLSLPAASSRPVSVRSTESVRLARLEQERVRAEYLQAQGFAPASVSSQSSIESAASSIRTNVSERVSRINQRLRSLHQPQNETICSTVPDAEAHTDENVTASRPVPKRYRLRSGFRAARKVEAGNWYTARESKTLPHRFQPPEGLLDTTPSPSEHPPSGCSSRAASLRIRNKRLPPGYNLPGNSAALIVASSSVQDGATHIPEGILRATSPFQRLSAAPLIPDPENYAEDTQRSSQNRTVDKTRSGEASLAISDNGPQREPGCSGLYEADTAARPELPPRSPDRLSARNSALQSNRGSVMWPIRESADPPLLESSAPQQTTATRREKQRNPWLKRSLLALLWAVVTALTIFGISNAYPYPHAPVCTSEEAESCASLPSSFIHAFRTTTVLPKTLRACLSPLHLNNIAVDLADHGLKLNSHNGESAHQMQIHGDLVVSTSFSDNNLHLLSNITYVGVVDGEKNEKQARRQLDKMLNVAKAGRVEEKVGIVSTQSASGVARDSGRGESQDLFLALWLACLLAVESTLLVYFVVLPLLWITASWLCKRQEPVGEGSGILEEAEKDWTQEMISIFTPALQWITAGALGSAVAGSILMSIQR